MAAFRWQTTSCRRSSGILAVGRAVLAVSVLGTPAMAANYYWDGNPTAEGAAANGTSDGGAGAWNKTDAVWDTGATYAAWADGNTANFGGAGGTVTLGVPISAVNLRLSGTGYTIAASDTNVLAFTGGNFASGTAAGTNATIYAGGPSGSVNTIGGAITFAGTANTNNPSFISVATGNSLNLTGTLTQLTNATSANTVFGPGTVNYSGTGWVTGKFNVQGGVTFNTSGPMSGFTNQYVGVADTVAGTNWNMNAGTAITAASSALFLGNGVGSSGTVVMNGGTATFGNGTNGSINVGAGFNGNGDGTGTLTINGGSMNAGATGMKIGNAKTGVGVVSLNGGTLTSAGSISLGAGTAAGTGGSGTINFNGGTLASAGTITVGSTLLTNVNNGGAIFDSTGSITVASNLVAAGAGGVTKNGAGILSLTGTNTFTGTVAVNAGTLSVGSATAIPDFSKVAVASGAFLAFNLPTFSSASIAASIAPVTFQPGAGVGLDVATGAVQTYSDALGGFTNFIKTGAGTLTLAGANTYTGTTTVAQGVLSQSSVASIANSSGLVLGSGANTGTFTYTGGVDTISLPIALGGTTGGGTLDLSSATGPVTVSSNVTSTVAGTKLFTLANASATNAVNFNGTVSDGAGVVGIAKTAGAGTVFLNTANNISGPNGVNQGVLTATASNALGTGVINITGGGTNTVANGGTLVLTGGITLPNSALVLTSRTDPATTTPTAHIENLSGNNTLGGNMSINLGGSGAIVQSDAGTLTLTGNVTNTSNAAFNRPLYIQGAGNVVLAGNLLAGTNNTSTNATNGLTIIKYGTGTTTISGAANTFFGGITVSAGTVALATSPGSGTIVNNANLAMVNSAPLAVTSVISGTGTVQQTGAGTTTISGANTYTGTTSVSSGTLVATSPAYANILSNGSAAGLDVTGGISVFDYTGTTSPVGQVKAILTSGYPNFALGQIRSSTLSAGKTIGYADDSSSKVTIRVTLPGDSNLDGKVDFNDFLVLQNSFGQADTRFDQGNFNYDNQTDFNDFLVLQNNFGQSLPGLVAAVSASEYAAVMSITSAGAVPEPTSLATCALAGLGLMTRRRRA